MTTPDSEECKLKDYCSREQKHNFGDVSYASKIFVFKFEPKKNNPKEHSRFKSSRFKSRLPI